MHQTWISPGSTTTGSVIDPLCAACEQGFVPDRLVFVQNPKVVGEMEDIAETAEDVVDIYGEVPHISFETISAETNFAEYYKAIDAIINESRENSDGDVEIAINMTPGRKYMSGIAMQTGMQADVDHVYYLLIEDDRHYGDQYHKIPSTATELYDFTEEV